jgi:NAD(P)H-flavin reductase
MGKCGHCQLGGYYVCKEGPVFTYPQLKAVKEAV